MRNTNTREEAVEDRRSPRLYLQAKAMLDAGPGKRAEVDVLNLSAHGLMAASALRLTPGRPVSVELLRIGKLAGRIAWIRDGHMGITFIKPLTLDQLSAYF